ncbi:MAG: glycosyltransferase family 39 protein [Planctomycetes bacterium]|nr:glycosyltransferase family 39 protein [Planctomycetota bacterium]MCC7170432.1 glycosyltransferase family 39 protein [Planctomycetota bacterium]
MGERARGSLREVRRRAWFCLVVVVVLVRLALLAFGRVPPVDAFYLNGALQLAHGRAPYEDFTHVAFPCVEWCYALLFRCFDARLCAASALTGVVVLLTVALWFKALVPRVGARAAAIGCALYATCAPLVAFAPFQREVWTNLLLAAAFERALRRKATGDADSAVAGAWLAGALLAKLTAGVGAIALALEWLASRRPRLALVAGGVAALVLATFSAACFARWEGEFAAQVFAFYAFKGEAGSASERAIAILRSLDPCLALGVFGIGFAAVTRRLRAARPFVLLLCLWLAHYVFVSPSFWDHNAIDLALPAAALAAFAIRALTIRRRRTLAIAACVVAICVGARGAAGDRPAWFPHGFGGGVDRTTSSAISTKVREAGTPDQLVVTGTPLHALESGRTPLVSDFELEPVARGVLLELRRFGIRAAFARKGEGVLLGVPIEQRMPAPPGSLFAQRVFGNALHHVLPRMLDAIDRREVAAVHLPGGLPGLTERLTKRGYVLADVDLWLIGAP